MINFQSINKTFNSNTPNETKVFAGFDLTIQKNEYVIIVGSNGSGKSTLLNLLAGTVLPDSGKILLDGIEISTLKDYNRSKYIARIFQNPLTGTAPDLSILENFRLASLRTQSKRFQIGTGERFKKEVRDKISLLNLGLENKIELPMGSLSGGQRQALTLVMAIMDKTQLLLLDEPTAALDPATARTLMELADKVIKDYSLTAVLVTHQMQDVIRHGNRVIHLDSGKIAHDLTLAAKKQLQLNTVFSWFGQ